MIACLLISVNSTQTVLIISTMTMMKCNVHIKGCVAWGALHTISGWFSRFSMSFYLTGPNMSSLWPCCQKLWPDKKVLTFWVGKLLFWESLLLCDVCKSHTGFCSLRIYKTHTIFLTGTTNHPQTKSSFSFLKSRWGCLLLYHIKYVLEFGLTYETGTA